MNRFSWRLVEFLSRGLEAGERTAVLGDLTESGDSGGAALRGVCGLLLRRQVEAWKTWGPWVAPLGMIAPLLFLKGARGGFNIGAWMARQLQNLWILGVSYEDGLTAADHVVLAASGSLLAIAWAWSGGFALGSLSRRAAWSHPALLFLLWWFAWTIGRIAVSPPHTGLLFLAVSIVLILIPLLCGVWQGTRGAIMGIRWAASIAAAMAILTSVEQVEASRQNLGFSLWRRGESLGGQLVWTPHPLPFAAILFQFAFLALSTRRRPVE